MQQMNRNERRRARRKSQSNPSDGMRIHLGCDPDIDFENGNFGQNLEVVLTIVDKLNYLVDGSLRQFSPATLKGTPVPPLLNDFAHAFGSGTIQQSRREPDVPSAVRFDLVNLRDREAFFSDDENLAAALWMAGAPLNPERDVSIPKLRAHVPSYRFVRQKTLVRLRDCVDFLSYAQFDDKLRDAIAA